MLSFPSLISTDQPSQTSQEDEGPEQPPKKARARSTGVMGLGRETCCLFFVEAPRPRISEACFPCLNSCVLHIQVVAKNVSPVLQSYRILLHVARRAKLHVLNTCVLSRKKTRISMSHRILHRTRCLGPQLLTSPYNICYVLKFARACVSPLLPDGTILMQSSRHEVVDGLRS